MDLRRYFQPVHRDALPDPKGPLSATIPRQTIAEANKRVQEAAIAKASKKRVSYGHFDAKTRAAIGKSSPLPRSRVFTRHCPAVVPSLATAPQKCLHSPLPHSCVFTRHCQWSTETLQCRRNSLARDTMSTM